jgi:hypothetical protein
MSKLCWMAMLRMSCRMVSGATPAWARDWLTMLSISFSPEGSSVVLDGAFAVVRGAMVVVVVAGACVVGVVLPGGGAVGGGDEDEQTTTTHESLGAAEADGIANASATAAGAIQPQRRRRWAVL